MNIETCGNKLFNAAVPTPLPPQFAEYSVPAYLFGFVI